MVMLVRCEGHTISLSSLPPLIGHTPVPLRLQKSAIVYDVPDAFAWGALNVDAIISHYPHDDTTVYDHLSIEGIRKVTDVHDGQFGRW